MREFTITELAALEILGDFQPTNKPLDCRIKGSVNGNTEYYDSHSLREFADALNSIAQWLDERANEYERVEKL